MKNIVFFDLETTGIGEEDRLVQVAYKAQSPDSKIPDFNRLYKPPVPISIEAMSVCHITPDMVKDQPLFKDGDEYESVKTYMEHKDIIHVAHNSAFDVAFFKKEGINVSNVICTFKLSHYIDVAGKLPQHKLQFLRYYYDLNVGGMAHDAWGDVLVLEALFNKYEKDMDISLEEMIKISSKPILLKKWPFGKYKAQPFGIAPPDYLQWAKDNIKDMGEDLSYTVNYWLEYNTKRR